MILETTSVEETREIGAKLAEVLNSGDVLALTGDLGSGKTELVRGFCLAVKCKDTVKSPSFALVNTYNTEKCRVHHFDFYRLYEIDELFEIGYDEYISDHDAISIIEWAEMFPDALPDNAKWIKFTEASRDKRVIEIEDGLI